MRGIAPSAMETPLEADLLEGFFMLEEPNQAVSVDEDADEYKAKTDHIFRRRVEMHDKNYKKGEVTDQEHAEEDQGEGAGPFSHVHHSIAQKENHTDSNHHGDRVLNGAVDITNQAVKIIGEVDARIRGGNGEFPADEWVGSVDPLENDDHSEKNQQTGECHQATRRRFSFYGCGR